jgi:bifunctional non-homologous end joining protein LigD
VIRSPVVSAPIRHVELFFQEGSSDKVYHATIVEDGGAYTVKVAWGRRGSTLNQGAKAVRVALAAAHKKFDALVREKTNKGYQEITAAVKPASVAPPVGEGSGSKAPRARAVVGHAAQLPNAIDEAELDRFLADDAMVAQQKIDGMRVLAHVGDELLVTNRDGQRTKVDLAAFAGLAYLPRGTIVDGELLDDGYWLFDVLQLAGEDVRARGYLDRFELLDNEVEPALTGDARVVPVAVGRAKKRTLHDRLRAAGAEGLIFKHRDAPYTPGRPASGGPQRKHKFIKTADVVILENAGNAYAMAVYDGRSLFEVGKVFAGTTNATRKALDAALARGDRPICEVKYLYATDDHQLYQPVFVRVRDDKPGNQCGRDQLRTTCRRVIA